MANNIKQKNIPNGWRLAKIGEIGNIVSGGTPSTEILEYWGGEIPWITPTEITKLKTKYIFDTERKITKLGLEKSSAKEIPPMSLIICSRATVGKCAINRKLVTTNQGFKNIVPNKNINIYFLYYYIYTQSNQLKRISSGSTFLEFSKFDLEKFKFLLPPLPEQNKLVQILETWDEYLEKITKKIEIKKSIKKGLMQKLLSGEMRIKGFTGDWNKKKLGEIVEYKNGGAFENNLSKNGNYFLITLNSIDINGKLKANHKKVDKADWYLEKDDLIMVLSDIAHGYFLGLVDKIPESNKYVLNQRMGLLRKKVNYIDIDFVKLYLNIKRIYFKMHGQGSSQQNLSKGDITKFKISLPPKDEQQAIAKIIITADYEIDYLENKKKIIEDQKRYLLNNLITGKIRIPEFSK